MGSQPPSNAGGASASACSSNVSTSLHGSMAPPSSSTRSQGSDADATRAAPSSRASSGTARSPSRSRTRSRGVALPCSTRATVRSRSPTGCNPSRTPTRSSVSSTKRATATCRTSSGASVVSGSATHWRSSRAPIGVRVWSSTSISAPCLAAPWLASSSRLRCVCPSRNMKASGLYQRTRSIWLMPSGWVSWRYCNTAPAARTASGRSWRPKPARDVVRKWSFSVSAAVRRSQCHAGQAVTRPCIQSPTGWSPTICARRSDGSSRSRSARVVGARSCVSWRRVGSSPGRTQALVLRH